jgi:CPA2 family monovalent cation:H+ antiporter-2
VANELEGIVALFTEVLHDYRVSADEILRYEEAIRDGSYAVLEGRGETRSSFVPCTLGENCLSQRTVTIRAGAPVAGRTWPDLNLESRFGARLVSHKRGAAELPLGAPFPTLLPGDQVVLEGSALAFAEAARFFAAAGVPITGPTNEPQRASWIDPAKPIHLQVTSGASCSHLSEIREVYPSAAGCEDCLRLGTRWVHLRACMSCGRIGCCDSSPNRHASKHHEATAHPIMRSMERGESWGWCFVDEVQL